MLTKSNQIQRIIFCLAFAFINASYSFISCLKVSASENNIQYYPNNKSNTSIFNILKNHDKSFGREDMYIVDNHQIYVERGRAGNILHFCELERDEQGQATCKDPHQNLLEVLDPYIVLPASIGESPSDFYFKRNSYLAQEYPAQDFVLILTKQSLSHQSIKITEILRENSIGNITIEHNDDTSWSNNPMCTPMFGGMVIQINLGYLEPNDYNIIMNWNYQKNDIQTGSVSETLNFRVYDENIE